ncbi:MAG: NFACT family protein [Solobacterium sp.]|nr:NFACT family protein [Solobacterium sp.]
MPLDGILLHKLIPGIREELPARIQKIYQIAPYEVLFQLHGKNGKKQLLISCHSRYNRILFTNRSYPTPSEPGNFIMLLRKYLEGATLLDAEQAGLDRWCTLTVRRRNELGDPELIQLVAELMGNYANLLLVRNGTVIDALKRIPPFENNKRMILPNAPFRPIPPQDKRDPFSDADIDPEKTLTQQFSGFSPFLSSEVEYRMARGQSFASVMQEIEQSEWIYIANRNNEAVFHCIELKSVGPCRSYGLFEGFDILYYHREEKERIREISGDVFHTVHRELKHQKLKLPRLLKEYDDALDCDRWKTYGDLLYTYQVRNTQGLSSIDLEDYETGKQIRIPLDPKLDGTRNAQKCYNRYQKYRKGQVYLQEQIQICEREISYFEGLLEQLEQADFSVAEGIREELVKGGYLSENAGSRKRKKKKTAPAGFWTVEFEGVQISYGRNNLQNDALTFHHARKNEIWFHAKDYHGSHVVAHTPEPSEAVLRLAAELAAYYSKGRDSSSVPVNYCPVSQLKKIPGAKPGMVQIGNYRTIFIDPDAEHLEACGIEID